MENGIVRRVIGPVVDVQFPSGNLPEIYNAIEIQLEDRKVVMEVVQLIGDNSVRCISLFSTDGISRGMPEMAHTPSISTGVSSLTNPGSWEKEPNSACPLTSRTTAPTTMV